jgi:hypothetical protein
MKSMLFVFISFSLVLKKKTAGNCMTLNRVPALQYIRPETSYR